MDVVGWFWIPLILNHHDVYVETVVTTYRCYMPILACFAGTTGWVHGWALLFDKDYSIFLLQRCNIKRRSDHHPNQLLVRSSDPIELRELHL